MAGSAAPPSRLPPPPAWDPQRYPPAPAVSRPATLVRLGRTPIAFLTRTAAEQGPVFSLRLPPMPALVCVTHPEGIREVLTDAERFAGGSAASLLKPWVGDRSLIVAEGERHLRNRKLLLPPFHGEHVQQWGERMRELARAELDVLPRGEAVAIRPMAQRLVLDVILRLVFGLDDAGRVAAFRRALVRMLGEGMTMTLFSPRLQRDLGPLSPGGQLARRRRAVDALITGELERRHVRGEQGDDVLGRLLVASDEDGAPGFTDAELLDELRGLVVAGHETTATALAWTVHLLAHHPEVQDRLARELVIGERTYLRAVIKESLRVRPAVFDAVRTARADTTVGGVPVPGGAIVSAMFTVTHHDGRLWDAPRAFRPERHLDDAKPPPYSYAPFGGGVRRCIGAALANLEVETAVEELIARARILPAGALEPERLHGVTMVPAQGGRVRLADR